MKCPFCEELDSKVVDSRLSGENNITRRRRECLKCKRRFTTYERIEDILPMVVKRDGRRELFDRQKILVGIKKACEKRPISMDKMEEAVDRIERIFQERTEKEVRSTEIGEVVMEKLRKLDNVAYVRFASVYRQFKDVSEFMNELQTIVQEDAKETVPER